MQIEPREIKAAASALEAVESIDRSIEWMGHDIEANVESYGEKVRNIFGRNRLSHLDHKDLGQIVLCAIINALLKLRNEKADEHSGLVLFPDQPCPEQFPQDDE